MENYKKSIFILEDDTLDCESITKTLNPDYSLTFAHTVYEAKAMLANSSKHDLFVIDGCLPDGDGVEFCQYLREKLKLLHVPIIFVSQRNDVSWKVAGFSSGADDYLSKPYEAVELKMRLNALFKRSTQLNNAEERMVGPLCIVHKQQRVFVENQDGRKEIELSQIEFRFLNYLIEHEGEILSRDRLIDSVWGGSVHVTDRNIDSHVSKIRKKLMNLKGMIRSIYGGGYTFDRDGLMERKTSLNQANNLKVS